jgi:hypothetical protein
VINLKFLQKNKKIEKNLDFSEIQMKLFNFILWGGILYLFIKYALHSK